MYTPIWRTLKKFSQKSVSAGASKLKVDISRFRLNCNTSSIYEKEYLFNQMSTNHILNNLLLFYLGLNYFSLYVCHLWI